MKLLRAPKNYLPALARLSNALRKRLPVPTRRIQIVIFSLVMLAVIFFGLTNGTATLPQK